MGISGLNNMSAYEAQTRISVELIDKAINQAQLHAAGVLDMLPPAGLNEVGGLFDTRA
jgi:hypothetical protein